MKGWVLEPILKVLRKWKERREKEKEYRRKRKIYLDKVRKLETWTNVPEGEPDDKV